jgi:hypothetical protein
MSKKGYKQTEEHKKNIGKANKNTCTPTIKKRYSLMYKGKKRPEFSGKNHPLFGTHPSLKTLKKLSDSHKGKKLSDITKEKLSKQRIGVKRPGIGFKISLSKIGKPNFKISGKNHYNWKGGVSKIEETIRHSMEYSEWVRKVFIRDNYICQKYKIRGGKLTAHHILNFSSNSNLRFDVNNGITLSEKAHKEFHKKYGIKNNTREQLLEFLIN